MDFIFYPIQFSFHIPIKDSSAEYLTDHVPGSNSTWDIAMSGRQQTHAASLL